jgi:hypothetical protein
MRVDETPVFCRVKVAALGSFDGSGNVAKLLGATVIPWTDLRQSDDVFAEVDVRGVLDSTAELHWLPGDAEIEIIERPRYADLPERLVRQAPTGLRIDLDIECPPLLWESNTLHSAVVGWKDPQISVEIILCALTVAPDHGDLRPTLLAGLKARYARVTREPNVFPPARYPWRQQLEADIDGILSL